MSIVIVKTITENTIIGNLSIVDEYSIELKDAAVIHMSYTDDGMPALYFTKYCVYTESFDIVLSKDHIMHIFYDPLKSVVEYYQEQVESFKNGYKKKKVAKKDSNEIYEKYKALFEKMRDDPEVH